MEMGEGKIRLESGAAVPDTEMTRLAKRAMPLLGDSDATISSKLTQLDSFYGKSLDVMDPRGVLRARSKNMTPALVNAAQGGEQGKVAPKEAAPAKTWDQQMEEQTRALHKAHPDWSGTQIYQELTKDLK